MKEFYVLFMMLYHPYTGTLSQVRMQSDIYGSAILYESKNSCKETAKTFPKKVVIPPGQLTYSATYRCDAFPKRDNE